MLDRGMMTSSGGSKVELQFKQAAYVVAAADIYRVVDHANEVSGKRAADLAAGDIVGGLGKLLGSRKLEAAA